MAPPNTKNVTLGRETNIYNPWRCYVLNNKNVLNNTNGTNQWLSDLCVRITWETCENSGCPPLPHVSGPEIMGWGLGICIMTSCQVMRLLV